MQRLKRPGFFCEIGHINLTTDQTLLWPLLLRGAFGQLSVCTWWLTFVFRETLHGALWKSELHEILREELLFCAREAHPQGFLKRRGDSAGRFPSSCDCFTVCLWLAASLQTTAGTELFVS